MENSKAMLTSFVQQFKLSTSQAPKSYEEKTYMAGVPYTSVVGSLMYGMVCNRPNLAYAISMVNRFMEELAKLIGNFEVGVEVFKRLKFKRQSRNEDYVVGYVDSKYIVGLDTRNSLIGYIFTMLEIALSWKSSLQIRDSVINN